MKTKVEVRAKALELAVKITTAQIENGYDGSNVRGVAELYEKYILGDADLPEREESIESQIGDVIEQIKKLYGAAGLGGCSVAPMNFVGELEKASVNNNRKYEKD